MTRTEYDLAQITPRTNWRSIAKFIDFYRYLEEEARLNPFLDLGFNIYSEPPVDVKQLRLVPKLVFLREDPHGVRHAFNHSMLGYIRLSPRTALELLALLYKVPPPRPGRRIKRARKQERTRAIDLG